MQFALKRAGDPSGRVVGKLSFIDLAGSERGADTYDNDRCAPAARAGAGHVRVRWPGRAQPWPASSPASAWPAQRAAPTPRTSTGLLPPAQGQKLPCMQCASKSSSWACWC